MWPREESRGKQGNATWSCKSRSMSSASSVALSPAPNIVCPWFGWWLSDGVVCYVLACGRSMSREVRRTKEENVSREIKKKNIKKKKARVRFRFCGCGCVSTWTSVRFPRTRMCQFLSITHARDCCRLHSNLEKCARDKKKAFLALPLHRQHLPRAHPPSIEILHQEPGQGNVQR